MTIKVYADGADLAKMSELARDPRIAGFTTNPSLARKAGVANYLDFCRAALDAAGGKPVSLEVLADEPQEIFSQGCLLANLAPNVVVKVPVMNTYGKTMTHVIRDLALDGVSLNVTAVFTPPQVQAVGEVLAARGPEDGRSIVSVFAGRVADAGVDPLQHVYNCRCALSSTCPHAEMLWASPRQTYDLTLAERAGCEIITMTPNLIAKLPLRGKDLTEYSRETVEMFYRDAQAAGFEL
jgi:transaldolase